MRVLKKTHTHIMKAARDTPECTDNVDNIVRGCAHYDDDDDDESITNALAPQNKSPLM